MPAKAELYRTAARVLGTLDKSGWILRYRYGDRRLLEDVVLPALDRDDEVASVLLIGCAWYTRHYPDLLPGTDVTTMEIDPAKAAFGGAQHIVANMADIVEHVAPESLDAIVCNGVLGWGLDQPEAVESAFAGAVACLKPGGLFLLGWNDISPRNACPPDTIAALSHLEAVDIPGLQTHSLIALERNQHCYQAWRKPLTA
ncbi:class I SAM-dependent methyltransferase [Salinicola rhizosphaerae]|uniref:Methyltransferase type 11 n=1 Tax=Salinicola rhizosphaerae TaxID=1443141 RepID=A0ABQ3DTN4_9GAMM|nr:methyltransferase domain-containing protein [Salinicola rhizosphaerae]GHB12679.1 methyltransferase type 11 [Salinicola rhizosphaerae]